MKKIYLQPLVDVTHVRFEGNLLSGTNNPQDQSQHGEGGEYQNEGKDKDPYDDDDDNGEINTQGKSWDDFNLPGWDD